MTVRLKSKHEIALMREAGRIVALTYEALRPHVKPGVSTLELDRIAEDFIRSRGAVPVYKGYSGADPDRGKKGQPAPFPATICVAVNDVIVHGIPKANERLRNGDIIGIDIGVRYRGWVGDACITFPVGTVDARSRKLIEVTKQALAIGIEQARVGNTVDDIGIAIQRYAESHGFSVVRDYGGHGVGQSLHEDPFIYHHGERPQRVALRAGMTFTVEPMLNVGRPDTKALRDGWTVKTADGSRSAQFEHTIAITDGEPLILTLP